MRRIDADALIADCNKYLGILNPDRDVKEYARIFWLISILRSAPAIEPERKKGKWVPAKDGYEDHVECTGCFKTYDWISQAQYYDFCPSCGADMRELENKPRP